MPPQLTFGAQSLPLAQGAHWPALQTPLKQTAAAEHTLPLLTRQRLNWHFPPAQSLSRSQAAPPGALHVPAVHIIVAQSPSARQPAHLLFAQSPLAQVRSFVQSPPVSVRQSPARQAPLPQSPSTAQLTPAALLHAPAPLQASAGLSQIIASFCPAGTLVHTPVDAARSHA